MSGGARSSISQITTVSATFAEDVTAYRAAGAGGIGIWEFKLADDGEAREVLYESGLAVTTCIPAVPSILPLPGMEGPAEPEARVAAIGESLHRLAAFEPTGVLCLTGPAGELGEDEARRIVVDGLRTLADVADRAGVRLGVEPIQRRFREEWTIVSSLPETLSLLDEVGRPNLGIMFDTWHLWDSGDVLDDLERHIDRLVGVHVADWRESTRNTNDRVFPGDGVAGLPALLGALDRAGWDGWYDVEIFSDLTLEDSLWRLAPLEAATRALDGLKRVREEERG